MGITKNEMIIISLILLSVFGLIRGGKKKIIRWLSYTSLVILFIILSVIGIYYLLENYFETIGIYGFYLIIFLMFIISITIVRQYFVGKGGDYSEKKMDTFTIKTIAKLKELKFSPLMTVILGIGFLLIAYFMIKSYSCSSLCSYYVSFDCLRCDLLLPGMVIFLPLGIFFISIGYIWNKNMENF